MNLSFLKYSFFVVLAAGILQSCKINHEYQRPQVSLSGLYRDAAGTDTNSIAKLPWSDLFSDPSLKALIADGIAQNLDLKIAATRVQAADAYYRQSGAAFLPTLSAGAQAGAARLAESQGAAARNSATQYQLGLSSAWEADIWGKLSSARKASLASLLQSEAYQRAVQTSVVAGIANYYYTLLALDRQLAITEQTVQNRAKITETIKVLKEAGNLTGAAVVQSEASRYAAEVTIPDLKQAIRETENALSVLTGRAPGAIQRGSLENQPQPALPATGVPLQLLANRPDVQQAEYNYRYFFEQSNVARASFYPSFTITGAAGLNSFTLSSFFNSSSFFANVAGGLTQPITNRRLNKTRLAVALAQEQEAQLSFQAKLLDAGQEVSDALSLYQSAADKSTVRVNQLASLQKSVEFTQELLRYGSANYTEVLTAQQSLLDAQLGSVNDRLQQLRATVALYRALGGGAK